MLTAMARFVVLAAAVAALGGSLFGYDTGVISGAILFVRPAFSLSTAQVELVVSAVLIGATIGAIGSARVTDRLGRRVVLLVAAVSFGVGAIGSALAPSVEMLIAARLLVGLAIGVASYAVPLYISELAPPASRCCQRRRAGSSATGRWTLRAASCCESGVRLRWSLSWLTSSPPFAHGRAAGRICWPRR
jgi:MFS family permease